MSFLSNILRTHNISKEWFRATKYDSILLRDVSLREFPQFLKANLGNNGWYRIQRFFMGNFPSIAYVGETKSFMGLLLFIFIPSMFNVIARWKFNYEKYATAKSLLITDEEWNELTESQKHHFNVFLVSHLLWPIPQPPHLPPPVEFIPAHWKDDPTAPIHQLNLPKRDAHH